MLFQSLSGIKSDCQSMKSDPDMSGLRSWFIQMDSMKPWTMERPVVNPLNHLNLQPERHHNSQILYTLRVLRTCHLSHIDPEVRTIPAEPSHVFARTGFRMPTFRSQDRLEGPYHSGLIDDWLLGANAYTLFHLSMILLDQVWPRAFMFCGEEGLNLLNLLK